MSVIYENSNYGVKGFVELENAAQEHGLCFASTHRIDFDEPGWGDHDYDDILDAVDRKQAARGARNCFVFVLKL